MKQIIILIILLFLLSCDEDENPVLPNGETYEGSGGTVSESGRWKEFNTSNSYLPSDIIRCLEIDENNNIWIGTDEGLVFYDESKWTIYNTNNSRIPKNQVWSLACEDDTVWVGLTDNGGLAKFDGNNWKIYNSDNTSFPSNPDEIELVITTIKIDSKHNIWIGTNNYGLYKFDKKNWTVYYPKYETPISSPAIAAIDIEENDIVWIGHEEVAGVDKFDGNNWTNYTPDNSPLPNWRIIDLYIDRMNVKWFATDFGLAEFNDIDWTVYDTTNTSIPDESIFTISSDSQNNLWVGTFSGALLNMNNNEWTTYYINDVSEPSVPYIPLYSIKVDQYDNKWFGTIGYGLYKFNEYGLDN
ncbi:MAG: two-component regulator propeller domain-containing protein [Ignavibacteria bacterium]|jgi:ligand-binding sensor domain-containing protein